MSRMKQSTQERGGWDRRAAYLAATSRRRPAPAAGPAHAAPLSHSRTLPVSAHGITSTDPPHLRRRRRPWHRHRAAVRRPWPPRARASPALAPPLRTPSSSASSPEPSAVASPLSRPTHVLRLLPLSPLSTAPIRLRASELESSSSQGMEIAALSRASEMIRMFQRHLTMMVASSILPNQRAPVLWRQKRRRWEVQMGSRSEISRTWVGSCKCRRQVCLLYCILTCVYFS
ncbi:hypothetical protein PVAP13_4KG281205 [Panicum virgatum]|uniref:Uncharacterized protein n=1 Tax=Panicum virgatum TaxID=38727 RepID=A0A8T0TWW8_PANVG|nr:hypothetical protein PVAP13_4KG281205 [Panicum virgatum]